MAATPGERIENEWRPADAFVLDALRDAEVCDLSLVYDSSNYVFLAALEHPEHGRGLGVYKPARGERPLHDFPPRTLYRREVAAYELARLLGWDLVPPTVGREGPHGPGSMQLFVEHDPSEHYFSLRDAGEHDDALVRMAAFDLLANNADRKGGHVVRDEDGHLWGIDNGLCFHEQMKVRTVIWDYSGRRLRKGWLQDVARVLDCLPEDEAAASLRACLSERELDALTGRCRAMLERPVLPEMFAYRCVPWPMI
jgi:uncharacterized repeat protein (TIGR03843 family)